MLRLSPRIFQAEKLTDYFDRPTVQDQLFYFHSTAAIALNY